MEKKQIKALTISKVQEMYLDRINNFLTDEKFCKYYEISLPEGKLIIEKGAELHELYASLYRSLNCLQNLK